MSNLGTDLTFTPTVGAIVAEPDCGEKCESYLWQGNVDYGQTITFTTIGGQSTIGCEEGTNYTATDPVTATVTGKVTHFANLVPIKSAPAISFRARPRASRHEKL